MTDLALCVYCIQPVAPNGGCWIGRGQLAHSECAWVVEEAFWEAFDAAEMEKELDASREA